MMNLVMISVGSMVNFQIQRSLAKNGLLPALVAERMNLMIVGMDCLMPVVEEKVVIVKVMEVIDREMIVKEAERIGEEAGRIVQVVMVVGIVVVGILVVEIAVVEIAVEILKVLVVMVAKKSYRHHQGCYYQVWNYPV